MGYIDKCPTCYGSGKSFAYDKATDSYPECACRRCGGSGKVAPYRVSIGLSEGASLGWNEMESSPRYGDEGCCVACNSLLPKRKRSFCGPSCKRGYLWRVWKGARWQKRAVACRDGSACKACGEVFESPIRPGGKPYPDYAMLELDHIRPLHRGGNESPANCQLLCIPCHREKTQRERRSIANPKEKA